MVFSTNIFQAYSGMIVSENNVLDFDKPRKTPAAL